MCWNGQASAALAIVGLSTTIYSWYKKEPTDLWMTLGYFSLMELLQAFTYLYLNMCDNPSNQVATYLGYLHITFQPFFVNFLCLHFIPKEIKTKIYPLVLTVCFFSAIILLMEIYPFSWAEPCMIGDPLCGKSLCSVSGEWHIAWDMPTNRIGKAINPYFGFYVLAAFVMPMLYGSWKMVLYSFFFGPFLAGLLSNNPNEVPAIWCLLSIGILIIVAKTKVRSLFYVKKWIFWPKLVDKKNIK